MALWGLLESSSFLVAVTALVETQTGGAWLLTFPLLESLLVPKKERAGIADEESLGLPKLRLPPLSHSIVPEPAPQFPDHAGELASTGQASELR